jgi:hypothetical protein
MRIRNNRNGNNLSYDACVLNVRVAYEAVFARPLQGHLSDASRDNKKN